MPGTDNETIKLLTDLFDERMTGEVKVAKLQEHYGLPMTREYEEVIGMCTYADAIEQKGIVKGRFEAEYTCFKNCLDRGKSYEEAQILSGASDENAEKYYQKWLKENKRN